MRTYLSLLWRSSATRRDRSPFRAWRESALVWRGRRGLFSRSLTMSAFPSCASKQAILSQFAASEGALYSSLGTNQNVTFLRNHPRSTFQRYVESATGDERVSLDSMSRAQLGKEP